MISFLKIGSNTFLLSHFLKTQSFWTVAFSFALTKADFLTTDELNCCICSTAIKSLNHFTLVLQTHEDYYF